jgi:tetratricopeptide (TPR) repeat protein
MDVLREIEMKRGFGIAMVLAGCLMAVPGLLAQAQGSNWASGSGDAGQKKPNGAQQQNGQQGAQPKPQSGGNPFPEDTNSVPVMPSKLTPDVPKGDFSEAEGGGIPAPRNDEDPVRSPDETGAGGGNAQDQESSSNTRSLDSLLPAPGDNDTNDRGKKRSSVLDGAPKETSTQDISVGKYYLDNKNWRAALSRFQSALVLAPDEPDVYWGLAESQRHLGDFANARANYQKVIDYDPDSKHAKEAKKALKDPEIANAKAAPGAQGPQ